VIRRGDLPLPPYANAPRYSPAAQPPVPPVPLPPANLNPPQEPSTSALLYGTPQDDSFPIRPDPGNPPLDGRTASLQELGRYLTGLVFCRVGPIGGQPIFFSIPLENFYVEEPGPEQDLEFPSMVVVGSESGIDGDWGGGTASRIGGKVPLDNTLNLFGYNTALVPQGEHEEVVELEVWSTEKPELRGIVAKLEQAFNPTQERSGVLLALPNYYFQTARFVHYGTRWPVEGAVRNRRKAVLKIWMAFDVVELVNVSQMTISGGQVDVEIPQYADPRVAVPTSSTRG
jgi:hypothetical protein